MRQTPRFLPPPSSSYVSINWYFVRDGARDGPRSPEEMAALFSGGVLGPETPVWTRGMENWGMASELPEFQDALRAGESPLPLPGTPAVAIGQGGANIEDAGNPALYPWRRWSARLVDFGCFCLAFGVFIEVSAPGTLTNANEVVLNAIMLALWVPVEAMVLSTFGTTPGKRMLGIRVANPDGTQLGLGQALNRSFQVWVMGFGIGIPVLLLITLMYGYFVLNRDGATPWDRRLGLVVTYSKVGAVRGAVITALIALFVFLAILGSLPAENL
jgi:hypothetical protein